MFIHEGAQALLEILHFLRMLEIHALSLRRVSRLIWLAVPCQSGGGKKAAKGKRPRILLFATRRRYFPVAPPPAGMFQYAQGLPARKPQQATESTLTTMPSDPHGQNHSAHASAARSVCRDFTHGDVMHGRRAHRSVAQDSAPFFAGRPGS
jgi:hypothetical protein